MSKMPVLFLAHGAPTIVLEDHDYTKWLHSVHLSIPKPKAIVVFSAHWEEQTQMVSAASVYETIYDFGGFPDEMYRITYPAPGYPQFAEQIVQLFRQHGVDSQLDVHRGLDHGVWTILKLVYPAADVPVIALSVKPQLSNREHYELGKAIASLRDEDVLIIGSGGTVHNLRQIHWRATEPIEWALGFDQWLQERIEAWDLDALFDYESLAPHALLAVPTREHFIPILLAMGAADETRKANLQFREFQYGTLSLSGWRFE